MVPPKYPRASLAEVRKVQVERAARRLTGAAGDRDDAERRRLAVERREDAHAAAAGDVREAERAALARGELTVADLVRADAWETRVAAERAAIAAEVDRARGDEARAADVERVARDDLARRDAEAQVVARDRARWQQASLKQAEKREEEASLEGWRPDRS